MFDYESDKKPIKYASERLKDKIKSINLNTSNNSVQAP